MCWDWVTVKIIVGCYCTSIVYSAVEAVIYSSYVPLRLEEFKTLKIPSFETVNVSSILVKISDSWIILATVYYTIGQSSDYETNKVEIFS